LAGHQREPRPLRLQFDLQGPPDGPRGAGESREGDGVVFRVEKPIIELRATRLQVRGHLDFGDVLLLHGGGKLESQHTLDRALGRGVAGPLLAKEILEQRSGAAGVGPPAEAEFKRSARKPSIAL
jgi:hypothetical protein